MRRLLLCLALLALASVAPGVAQDIRNWANANGSNFLLPAAWRNLGQKNFVVTQAPYNAMGDNVADDTAAITAACNAANAATPAGATVYFPAGKYKISGPACAITASNIKLYFEPGTVINATSNTAYTAFSFAGTMGTPLTLSSTATQDTNTVVLTATTGLSIGGYIYMEKLAPNNGQTGSTYRFASKIQNIAGNTVTLFNSLPVTFFTSTQSGSTHSNTVVDGLTSTTGMAVGQRVTGANIPVNTTIATITGPTSITISNAATSTTTLSLTFADLTNVIQNGSLHSNTTVDNLTTTSGIAIGDPVTGTGIQAGTTVASIVSPTSITISLAATLTQVSSLTFNDPIFIAPLTPLSNVGIDGALSFDGTNHTTGVLTAINASNTTDSSFRGIQCINTNPGQCFATNSTYNHSGSLDDVFDNITADNGSDGNNVAINLIGETMGKASNIRVNGGTGSGFGINIVASTYFTGTNLTSNGDAQQTGQGRNIKVQACVGCNFANLVGNAGGDNGLAIAVGTTRTNFTNITTNYNLSSEGIWFSDQFNTNNSVANCTAYNNALRDVYVGITDTGNQISNCRTGFIQNLSDASIFPGRDARNYLINGGFQFDQVFEGASQTTDSVGGVFFGPDGWKIQSVTTATAATMQRVTDAPQGAQFSTKITIGTGNATVNAGDFSRFMQLVEANRLQDLGWGGGTSTAPGPLALSASVWLKSSVTGTIGVVVYNEAGTRSWVHNCAVTAATWKWCSWRIIGDPTGTWVLSGPNSGLRFQVTLESGTSFQGPADTWNSSLVMATNLQTQLTQTTGATLQIAGAKLSPEPVPTPYLARSYADELSAVQRFYAKTFKQGTAVAQNAGIAGTLGTVASVTNAGAISVNWRFPVEMSCIPTIVTYNPSVANANWRNVTGAADAVVAVDPAAGKSTTGVEISEQTTALVVANRYYIHATADCRL